MTSNFLFLAISFGGGMLLQALLLLRFRLDYTERWKMAGCILSVLLGLMPGRNESGSDYFLPLHIFSGFLVAAIIFAVVFRERVLPILNEHIILGWTILFIYACLHFFPREIVFTYIGVPTLLALGACIVPFQHPMFIKILLYTWFLSIGVTMGIMQWQSSTIAFFWVPDFLPMSVAQAFLSGMACLLLALYIVYLLLLIPWPDDRLNFRESWEVVKEHSGIFAKKFSNTQLHIRDMVLLVAIGGVPMLNDLLKFLSPWLLINMFIVLFPYIFATSHNMKVHTNKRT